MPGGAFESEDQPDPPGLDFIRPGNRGHPARDGGLTRSHAPRVNALFDALRRLRSPRHQSVVTPTNDSIRA